MGNILLTGQTIRSHNIGRTESQVKVYLTYQRKIFRYVLVRFSMIWYDLDTIWYDVLGNLVRRMPFGTILDEIWYDLVQSNLSVNPHFDLCA